MTVAYYYLWKFRPYTCFNSLKVPIKKNRDREGERGKGGGMKMIKDSIQASFSLIVVILLLSTELE